MSDRIERQLLIDAPIEDVWEAITGDGWLADEVDLDLTPGGEACFRSSDATVKTGWVEDVRALERLTFWWETDSEPATRVEIALVPAEAGTVLRVVETRPLDVLDLVGVPLRHVGGRTYGPALVAA